MDWKHVVGTIHKLRPAVRIKWNGDSEMPEWAPWVIMPTDGYIETGSMGPVPIKDVEWIEVDASHTSKNGRLVPCSDVQNAVRALKEDCILWAFDGTIARIIVQSDA